MNADVGEHLRTCGLFQGLSPADRERVAAIGRFETFKRGESIFREGDKCPGIFVVADGAVRVFKMAPNGKEHVLHVAVRGKTFAEVAAIGGFACPANATAVESTTCVLLPRREFRQLLETDHAFCLAMMTGMTRWVRRLVGLLEDLVLRDATARVARHLLAVAPANAIEFELPMRKRDLASHLNLTSETLSRTLRRLSVSGLLTTRHGGLRILCRPLLEEIAEGLPPSEFD